MDNGKVTIPSIYNISPKSEPAKLKIPSIHDFELPKSPQNATALSVYKNVVNDKREQAINNFGRNPISANTDDKIINNTMSIALAPVAGLQRTIEGMEVTLAKAVNDIGKKLNINSKFDVPKDNIPSIDVNSFRSSSDVQDAAQMFRSKASPVAGIVSDVTGNVASMMPSIAVSVLTGNPLLSAATVGSSTHGSSYKEAINEGKTNSQASSYALLSGAMEGGLQYLLGGIKGVSRNIFSKPINAAAKALSKSPVVQESINIIGRMASEGTEEYLQEIFSPVIRNLTLGENNEFKAVTPEALYAGALGALTAGLMNLPSDIQGMKNARAESKAIKQLKEMGIDVSQETYNPILGETEKNALWEKNERDIADLEKNGPLKSSESILDPKTKQALDEKNAKDLAAFGMGEDTHTDSTHTPEQIRTMKEYEASVDNNLLEFIHNVRNGTVNRKARYYLGDVSDRAAKEVSNLVGFDISGYRNALMPQTVEHIDKRHGINGSGDKSMSSDADIARVQYVLDNYDTVINTGEKATGYTNKDGRRAPTVVYMKKIDGSYYVIMAVPDTASKTNIVISAFKMKDGAKPFGNIGKEVDQQPLDADAPQITSETATAVPTSFDTNVPQDTNDVNTSIRQDGTNNSGGQNSPFGPNTVGAAEYNPQNYYALGMEYGTIAPGENPVRNVDAPVSTDGTDRVSQTARTFMEAGITPDAVVNEFQTQIENGTFSHIPITDESALKYANKVISNSGFKKALDMWNSNINAGKQLGKDEIALGAMLYNAAANAGDVQTAMKLAAEIAAIATNDAQVIQAIRLVKKMSPAGQLYHAQQSVKNLQKELNERYKKNAPELNIPEELAQNLLNATSTEEVNAANDAIFQYVANQVPATWMDKWNAWRYLSMLANPNTHFRNIVGNAAFTPVKKAKDIIGAMLESSYNKVRAAKGLETIERTKSVLIPGRDNDYWEFAKNDYPEVESILRGTGKYNPSSKINDLRTIFKNKALEWARKTNSNALDIEDSWFLRLHYTDSFAQWMKANNYTTEFLNGNTEQGRSALARGRAYAIEEALKATYRDDSKLANWINRLAKTKGGKVIVEGIIPFRKTPINIVKRGVEYSPIWLVKGLYDAASGKKSVMGAIDEISSGLTGTGILALGMWLASMGLLRGGSEKSKEDEFEQLQGYQDYSINLFGKNYTLEWLSPSAMPLFVGAELWNFMQGRDGEVNIPDMLDSLARIGNPTIEMSMLQGIESVIKTAGYSDKPLFDLAGTVIGNYMSQGIPSILGSMSRTIDGTRRSVYVDKNSQVPSYVQRFAQRNIMKTPFSFTLQPKVDQWGRTDTENNVVSRAIQNFASPGYLNDINTTDVERELQSIYDSVGDAGVFPTTPSKDFKVDGRTIYLSGDQYTKCAQTKGQLSYQYLNKLIGNPQFKALNDTDKAGVIKRVYDYAGAIAKSKVSAYKVDGWVEKAQRAEQRGIPIDQYFLYVDAIGNMEADKDRNGESIPGTKKEKIVAYIQDMNISDEQKKLLLEDNGYKTTSTKSSFSIPSIKGDFKIPSIK